MTGSDMRGDRDLAVVRQVVQRMGALDVDGALELVTDDLVLELPFRHDGGARTLSGGDARRFMRLLPALLDELRFEDITIHGALPSGEIVAEYRGNGRTRSGRPYRNTYVGFFTVHDGLVSRWREFFDPIVTSESFREAN